MLYLSLEAMRIGEEGYACPCNNATMDSIPG
jgi:hypothetical protein